jgi:hypothetical protein
MALSGLNLPNAGDLETGFVACGDHAFQAPLSRATPAPVLQSTVDALNQSVD